MGSLRQPSYLDACVAAEIEVKLKRMGDVGVHSGPSGNVTTLSNLYRDKNNHDPKTCLGPNKDHTTLSTLTTMSKVKMFSEGT